MATHSDLAKYLGAGREFMQQTRNPDFRNHLRKIGWDPGDDVVIAFDEESIVSLLSRLVYNEASSPCLVAIPHSEERFSFRLMIMKAVREKRGRRRAEPISPQSSVGMLYSSLDKCQTLIPSDWSPSPSPFMFSRVPEPA